MRFDDSLKTVLAADTTSVFGAQAAFRQLVDLAARGRAPADETLISRLRALRDAVPAPVRAASARSLALAQPPAALVRLFAEDEPAIAGAVLRAVPLPAADWSALLPAVGPAGRAVLRQRRDLPGSVRRDLEAFGAVDFTIGFERADADEPADPQAPDPQPDMETAPSAEAALPEPDVGAAAEAPGEAVPFIAAPDPMPEPAIAMVPDPAPAAPGFAPAAAPDFVSVGAIARDLPAVAEAMRLVAVSTPSDPPASDEEPRRGFEVADLVHRIEAFRRERGDGAAAIAPVEPPVRAFGFETDAAGIVVQAEGPARSALIGVDLARGGGLVQVEAAIAGALRRRTGIAEARLVIGGEGEGAGEWRLAADAAFDPATGRFQGLRGIARRPRPDQAPPAEPPPPGAEALRRLVHELRTPASAIAGFAELIETEMLGPVADPQRARAAAVRRDAAGLVEAIEDLELSARIAGGAVDLRPGEIAVAPLLGEAAAPLGALGAERGAVLALDTIEPGLTATADQVAARRLVGRLLAALLAVAEAGERLGVRARRAGDAVEIAITAPRALAGIEGADAEAGGDAPGGAPLLGIGFALRLARALARELGGSLETGAATVLLRLPGGEPEAAQASSR